MSAPAGLSPQFASDNWSGICPEAWVALSEANSGHAPAYGGDDWTAAAVTAIRELFDTECDVFFVFTGTAANSLGIAAMARNTDAVICSNNAHILVDECGAPGFFSGGAKLLPAETPDAKLTIEMIEKLAVTPHDVHSSRPKVVALTQATELGTVYTPAELAALSAEAHANGLLVHVDGARLANAAAALGVEPAVLAGRAGVDVLTLGLTKCGALLAEAVVLLRPGLGEGIPYARKQAMQLVSKGRFLGAQVTALLEDGLWLRLAAHANAMAALLVDRLDGVVELAHPVETNAVFARVDENAATALERAGALHSWSPGVVRWMTAWDTTTEDVEAFATRVRAVLPG